MLLELCTELRIAWIQRRNKCEDNLAIADNMSAIVSVARLKTLKNVKSLLLLSMQDTQSRILLCRMMQPAWRYQRGT